LVGRGYGSQLATASFLTCTVVREVLRTRAEQHGYGIPKLIQKMGPRDIAI
jgi:hypothetical protein